MCLQYLSFLTKIDRKILIPFIKITSNDFYLWNNRTYSTLNTVLNTPFKDLNFYSKNENLFVLSQPEVWLLYYKDSDFINFIKENQIEKNDDYGEKWCVVFKFYENNHI